MDRNSATPRPHSFKNLIGLDRGEAEVIALACETKANLVIIDESLGRAHAKRLGLELTGTLGVLLRAKKSGYIQELRPLLTLLRERGVWISERVFEEVLRLSEE